MRHFLLLLCVLTGCKKSAPSSTEGPAVAAEKLPPVGVDDPFPRLNDATARALKAGFKALRGKSYDQARASFHEVVAAHPDYVKARYHELRAAALAGAYGDLPTMWAELLARDFVGYAGSLDQAKDLAALRKADEWPRLQAIEKQVRGAYASGLDKGLIFVARTRPGRSKRPDNHSEVTAFASGQEAFHYDPASQRYRRLTATDARILAIAVSPNRQQLSFLTCEHLGDECEAQDDGVNYCSVGCAGPLGGAIELGSLTRHGPASILGRNSRTVPTGGVYLGWSKSGEPRFLVEDATRKEVGRHEYEKEVTRETAYAFDATHTALVSLDDKDASLWTRVEGLDAAPVTPSTDGVSLTSDGLALQIAGEAAPLRAGRTIVTTTWSPGKKRLLYAGDPCAGFKVKGGKGVPEKNELYLWDAGKKKAERIARAAATFDALWLDDDHLAWVTGFGKEAKIHLYDLATRTERPLKAGRGAGLWRVPELSCDEAPEPYDDGIAADDEEEFVDGE